MNSTISFNRPTHPGTGAVHFVVKVRPEDVRASALHIVNGGIVNGDIVNGDIGEAGYVSDVFPAGTSVEDAVAALQGTPWGLEPLGQLTVKDRDGNNVHMFHLTADH